MGKQKKKMSVILGVVLFVTLLTVLFINIQSEGKKLDSLLDLGKKYLEELDYEAAIVVFDEAIAIEPKCEEAYIGKATAQYGLQLYQDAIDTLEEGIQRVEDVSRLVELLDSIQNELDLQNQKEESSLSTEQVIEPPKEFESSLDPLVLNYINIVRYADTEEADVQLEVLGYEKSAADLQWESSNPECAIVSENGLVTCLQTEGKTEIRVTDGQRSASCRVSIVNAEGYDYKEGWVNNTVKLVPEQEGDSKTQYISIMLSKEEDDNVGSIFQNLGLNQYIYYSGNIRIPEHLLLYGRNEIKIKYIESSTFRWCSSLETIYIPASVEEFGGEVNPFLYCTSLKEIVVDENSAFFQMVDGVLYSKDGKTLIAYPADKNDSTYMIPKEVEKIYSGAFAGCKNLVEINVEPENPYYKSVDGMLVRMKGNGLLAYPIGRKESSCVIPEGIQSIKENSFFNSNLEVIECGSDIWWIDGEAFHDCKKLKELKGMEKVEYFPKSSIKGCDSLEKIGGGW